MKFRSGWVVVALSALTGAIAAAAAAGGCQSDSQSGLTGSGGGGGEPSGSGATTTTANGGTGGSSSAGGAAGNNSGCVDAPEATIADVTGGMYMPDTAISMKGVVAMSQKWLVSKSKSSGSCLWGVFLSTGGLTETGPNTGVLAVSYGTKAMTVDGGQVYCPEIGGDPPPGDAFPDDVKPGDVLDLVGKVDYFVLNQCATEPNGASAKQWQVKNVCKANRTGTAAVPTPHVMSAAEIAQLASPTDTAFHDQWGGVKIAIQNVSTSAAPNMYGVVTLDQSGLAVTDKIYYRPYAPDGDICHVGPTYTLSSGTYSWTNIAGFNYIDFCTWSVGVNDKCADFAPSSEDCGTMTSCP